MAAEHEARGLLNQLAMATRCHKLAPADGHEAAQWATDEADARTRLERLYAAGLPRHFIAA